MLNSVSHNYSIPGVYSEFSDKRQEGGGRVLGGRRQIGKEGPCQTKGLLPTEHTIPKGTLESGAHSINPYGVGKYPAEDTALPHTPQLFRDTWAATMMFPLDQFELSLLSFPP